MSALTEFETGLSELFDQLAETVTREIAGDTNDTASQTALVDASAVEKNDSRGRAFVYDFEMQLKTADTVTEADTYLIRSERCKVSKIGKVQHGLRMVYLTRVEQDRREAKGSRVLR